MGLQPRESICRVQAPHHQVAFCTLYVSRSQNKWRDHYFGRNLGVSSISTCLGQRIWKHMKTTETYKKAEQNPLGICDQHSNVPQRHFLSSCSCETSCKGTQGGSQKPQGMISPEKTCKKVIMTFTLTVKRDFHSLSTTFVTESDT